MDYVLNSLAKKFKGKCLSKYISLRTDCTWQCNKNHIFTAKPQNVKRGSWCGECKKQQDLFIRSKKELPLLRAIAKNNGGKLLSKKYVNNSSKLKWQCGCGNIWEATPNNIKNKKWCPVCAAKKRTNKKYSINYFKKIAIFRGGKCLSQSYSSINCKLLWQCSRNHNWEARASSILCGSWCSKCKESRSESICRSFFEKAFDKKFTKTRPDWLNGLELDGFCKELNLAFEHNGEQHYHPIYGEKSLEKTKTNDRIKEKLCRENGVNLITIKSLFYKTSIDELIEIIKKSYLKKHNKKIDSFKPSVDDLNLYNDDYVSKIDNIIAMNSGVRISKSITCAKDKIKVRCSFGHVWEISPNKITMKRWCPTCAIQKNANKQRKSLDDILLILQNRGGFYISGDYINNKTKIRVACDKNHEWDVIPSSLRRGSWCPFCAKNKR